MQRQKLANQRGRTCKPKLLGACTVILPDKASFDWRTESFNPSNVDQRAGFYKIGLPASVRLTCRVRVNKARPTSASRSNTSLLTLSRERDRRRPAAAKHLSPLSE